MSITDHRFAARQSAVAVGGDILLALLVCLLWWILCHHQDPGTSRWLWLIALSTVGVAIWRAAPVPALALSVGAAAALALDGAVQWPPLAPLVVLYLVTATSRSQRRAVMLPCAGALVYLVALVFSGTAGIQDGAHAVLGFAVAWFAGERSRLRQAQISALHDRIQATAESKARDAQLAVVEERSRIARDLHDSAGHAINVIAVRAGATRLRNDPAAALTALADIEQIARDTAADIDAIVGALRERDEPPRMPIGLAAADTLIGQHRAAGLEVATRYDGDLPSLSPAADQAAFRVLQEALTNAARHGRGTVDVRFLGEDGCLSLTVSNSTDRATRPEAAEERATAHGLIGMRERASMLGGSVAVERPPGHFVVRLRLPGTEVVNR